MKTSMRVLLAAVTALAFSQAAQAELGGAASTLQNDRMQMKAAVPVASTKLNYTVHEMTLSSGTTVREYIANEKVFAVAWRGQHKPDLKQLMGPYFETYTKEALTHRSGHSHVAIEHPDFVMHAAGHMRYSAGSAYIPGMLPQGVTAQDIR